MKALALPCFSCQMRSNKEGWLYTLSAPITVLETSANPFWGAMTINVAKTLDGTFNY
jgi:hypothetical protein